MASWSTKRKYSYFIVFIFTAILLFGVPSFFLFYRTPTCFDGKQNGRETGIDCGGGCSRLCPADFAEPRVLWSHSVKVLPGVYNALAYAQNPNPWVETLALPYLFKLYDDQGILVSSRVGSAYVPAGQKFAVFEGGIETGNRTPTRTTFEFTDLPDWKQASVLSKIRTLNVNLDEIGQPKASVSIKNEAVDRSFSDITAFIILYDKNDNRVSFSKTIIDAIGPGETQVMNFTWPESFASNILRTEVLFVGNPN